MIVGPAKFPVARAQKYSNWTDNKYNEFTHWRTRILAAFARSERKRTQGSELDRAQASLASYKRMHEAMKQANIIIRKHKGADTCIPECVALGISEADMMQLLNPKYSFEKKGFQTWQLSNSNANITRLEQRDRRAHV